MTAFESRKLAPWLWLLLAMFCFRVLAQLLQWRFYVEFLPPFAAWHSGALPYGVLFASQLLIIVVMSRICYSFSQGSVVARRNVGLTLLVFGAVYFLLMLGRLFLGLFVLPEHSWFGQTLPAVFHLVLAIFLLFVGHYHFSHTGRRMQ